MSVSPQKRNAALVVTGCMAAMFATSPGQTFVISTFNDSLTEALGITSTGLALAYLVGTLVSAASLTQIGRLADRIGPRRIIGLASIGLALAGVALVSATGFWSLAAAFFLLRVFGQGSLSLASSHALALRFEAHLGAVEGLRGATVSVAIAVVPQVSIALIATHGWRTAVVALTVGAGAIGLAAALFLIDKDPPRSHAKTASTGASVSMDGSFTLPEARRTRALWILFACLAASAAVVTAAHFHLQPILAAGGLSEALAAQTFVSFAVAGLLTTLVGGLLVDRIDPAPLLGVAITLLAVGAFVMAIPPTVFTVHAGMAALGLSHGLISAAIAPTIARYFGRAHHGAIRGMSGAVAVAGSAGGPWALSIVADLGGGFPVALVALGSVTLLVALAAFTLRRPVPPTRT